MSVSRPSPASRRVLGGALACGALGAALVLVAAGQVWGEASTVFARGTLPVEVTGSEVSGLPGALALVGLAALVAVFAVRRTGRTLVAALLTLCGAVIVISGLRGSADTAALHAQAAEATGLSQSPLSDITHSAWSWAAVFGGVLLFLAGLLALRYGQHWPALSSRYERPSTSGADRQAPRDPVDVDRPQDLWQALDRGEDPTGR